MYPRMGDITSIPARPGRRIIALFAAAAVALSVGVVGTVSAAPAAYGATKVVAKQSTKLLTATNAQRKAHGLPALKYSGDLKRQACTWAKKIATSGKLVHGTNKTKYKRWGENIAYGYANSAKVTSAWMSSTGHKANILNKSYTRMGGCYADSPNGRRFWVQQFGG